MAGQITKRNDNTWLVRIFLGRDAKGKRKYFNKTIRGTKKDAQKYLTAKLREKDLGVFVEPASMILNEFLDKWISEVAHNKVRERTLDGYKSLLNCHVREKLGNKKLSDIQSYEIQKLYNDLKKKEFSPKTIRHVHNVLSSALTQAVKWRMLIQNPCDICELPQMEKPEMKYFTPEEAALFLETAKEDKYYSIFLVAIETGMRPEEYLGLQWKDVDFNKKVISVRRVLVLRKGGGFVFTEPKTKKSRRSIPISDSVANALKLHRKNQLQARLKLKIPYQDFDLVFASEIGTPLQHQNLTRRHFKPIRDKAEKYELKEDAGKYTCPSCRQKTLIPYFDKFTGEMLSTDYGCCEREKECRYQNKPEGLPKIRLYDLRHTTATLLLISGENPKVVSERLGHASIVLTLDTYSHVLPTMQKDATNKLEKMLYG